VASMRLYLKKTIIFAASACIAFTISACKEHTKTYSPKSVAQNQEFANKQAELANEAQLKKSPIPSVQPIADRLSHPLVPQS
jgi:hypothetical protein